MGGAGAAVLFRKSLDLKLWTIFLESEGRLIVLAVDGSNGSAIRLITVCAILKRADGLLSTSRSFPGNVSTISFTGALECYLGFVFRL